MTVLSDKMRAIAPQHPGHADELIKRADRFDAVHKAYHADEVGTTALLGAWTKARRLYCTVTGEELV